MMSHQDNETLVAEIAQLRHRLATLEAGTTAEPSASAFRSDEICRLMFDSNPYPVWVCNRQTYQILAANTAARTLYGYSADAFLSLTLAQLQAADAPLPILEHILPQGWHKVGVQRHCRRDGTSIA